MELNIFIKNMTYALENQAKFVCRDLSEDDFRWRSSETNNPCIGWYLGHVLVFLDFIMNYVLFEKGYKLSDYYRENFHMNTEGNMPEEITSQELFTKFKEINSSIVEEILKKEPSWFNELPKDVSYFPPNWQNKNNGKLLVLHFNHCLSHLGQILEIRRALGKEIWGF